MPAGDTDPFDLDFDCDLVKQKVRVSGTLTRLYGQGQFPIGIVRRMTGCSGTGLCGLFPTPSSFNVQASPCPYHTGLRQG
jgi:hypothetical protein